MVVHSLFQPGSLLNACGSLIDRVKRDRCGQKKLCNSVWRIQSRTLHAVTYTSSEFHVVCLHTLGILLLAVKSASGSFGAPVGRASGTCRPKVVFWALLTSAFMAPWNHARPAVLQAAPPRRAERILLLPTEGEQSTALHVADSSAVPLTAPARGTFRIGLLLLNRARIITSEHGARVQVPTAAPARGPVLVGLVLQRVRRGHAVRDDALISMRLAPPARRSPLILDRLFYERCGRALRHVACVIVPLTAPPRGTSIVCVRNLIPRRCIAANDVAHVTMLHASPAGFREMIFLHTDEARSVAAGDIALTRMLHAS